MLYCNIPNCGNAFKSYEQAQSNAKLGKKFPDHLQKSKWIFMKKIFGAQKSSDNTA